MTPGTPLVRTVGAINLPSELRVQSPRPLPSASLRVASALRLSPPIKHIKTRSKPGLISQRHISTGRYREGFSENLTGTPRYVLLLPVTGS